MTKPSVLIKRTPGYYNNRGFALNGKKDYDRAIEDLDRAIKLDSRQAMFYNNRGVAYMRKGLYDEALTNFDKAIEIDSKFWSAYHNRGMVFSGKGRHDKAVEEFSKVIEANPNSQPVLYKDRGTAYRKLGDYDSAIKDLEKAIELDKKFTPAYAELGLLHALAPEPPHRNPRKALSLAERAVQLSGGQNSDLVQNLAEVQYALNRSDEAVRTLGRALEMDPGNKDYLELMNKWRGGATRAEAPIARPGGGPFQDFGDRHKISAMTDPEREKAIKLYFINHVQWNERIAPSLLHERTMNRFEKALALLPLEAGDRFLSGDVNLSLLVAPDPGLPLGMRTKSEGPPDSRRCVIVVYEEHEGWPEDLFIAAFLRELAHVVAGSPPEAEWPTSRSDRSRYKEMLECRADALVWQWGLRHYSMVHLKATYPAHRLDTIIADIEKTLREGFLATGKDET